MRARSKGREHYDENNRDGWTTSPGDGQGSVCPSALQRQEAELTGNSVAANFPQKAAQDDDES